MDLWLHDLRYATRQLRKAPGFALASILTLALGIGALSAVFSVADAVLLQPLPYQQPEELDLIRISIGEAEKLASISAPELVDFRTRSTLYEDFAAFWIGSSVLLGEGEAEQVASGWASANLFTLLGITPALGRTFEVTEEKPGTPPVVMLDHGFWQRRFGGDPDVIGRVIEVENTARTVVGVLPASFRLLMRRTSGFYSAPAVWIPNTYWENRDLHWLRAIGRRQAGVSPAQGQAEMAAIAASLAAEHSEYAATGVEFHAVPLHQDLVTASRPALLALLGTVAFLLLIACANVAGMSLARAAARRGEITVRAALGAGRLRLVRQLLTESALLALIGGVGGLLLARFGVKLLAVLQPAELPRLETVAVDGRVLAFVAAVTVLTLFLAGLSAALHASRAELGGGLRSARAGHGRQRDRRLNLLVAAEVALALTLLIAAGLMIRSFAGLQEVALGFEPEQVLTLRLTLPNTYDSPEERFAFLQQAREEIAGLPAVEAVGGAHWLPFSGHFNTGHYAFDAASEAALGQREAEYRILLPGFFESVGSRFAAGRAFTDADVLAGRKVAIIDEDLARIAWPGEPAVGKKIKAGMQDEEWHEVVGVVAHLRQEGLRNAERPQIYLPYNGSTALSLTVKASGDLEALGAALRTRLHALDPTVPIADLRPLTTYVSDILASTRFVLVMMGIFAGIALALATVGLYATLAFWVGERKRGIGVRLAVGAQQRDILAMVLRHGLLVTTIGLATGLAASVGLTRALDSLLYGVSPTDPLTFGALALLLFAVAAMACLLPARRAARLEPTAILRSE